MSEIFEVIEELVLAGMDIARINMTHADHEFCRDVIEKVKDLIIKNKSDIDNIDIKVENEKIYITLEDKLDKKVSLLNKTNIFKVRSSYVGYLSDNKKVVEREL